MCLDAAAVIPLLWASHVPLAEERLRELKARWVRWVLHHPASHFSLINSTIPFAARSPVPPSVPGISSTPGTTSPPLQGRQPGHFAPHCCGRGGAVWFYTSTDELSSFFANANPNPVECVSFLAHLSVLLLWVCCVLRLKRGLKTTSSA